MQQEKIILIVEMDKGLGSIGNETSPLMQSQWNA